MASRERAVHLGAARSRDVLARLTREARDARLGAGLAQAEVAAALDLSAAQYSRIERGRSPDLSIDLAIRLFTVLGMELGVRAYPSGDPLRDQGQLALLDRFRRACHHSIRWRSEVVFPIPGDLRAWDLAGVLPGLRIGVEGETRLHDIQALDRRLALKERDGGMDRLILVVLGSRTNRSIVRAHADVLHGRFPVPGPRALELLAAAVDPGGNALILL